MPDNRMINSDSLYSGCACFKSTTVRISALFVRHLYGVRCTPVHFSLCICLHFCAYFVGVGAGVGAEVGAETLCTLPQIHTLLHKFIV